MDYTMTMITEYMLANKLVQNVDKTQLIVMSKDPTIRNKVVIKTEDETILPVTNFKYLGIFLNEKLEWKYFLSESPNSLIKQLNKRIAALKTIRRYTNIGLMKLLANGLFQLKLLYGSAPWSAAPKYLKRKIQTLQLNSVRLILGPTSFRRSTKYLLEQMKWISVEKIIWSSSARLTHQIINYKSPQHLYVKMKGHITTPRHTRISGNDSLGSRPRHIGRTLLTRQQYPAKVYE